MSGLGGDEQFVPIGHEGFLHNHSESLFGGTVGRTVIVGEVEMRDSTVEGIVRHGLGIGKCVHVAEVVPQSE